MKSPFVSIRSDGGADSEDQGNGRERLSNPILREFRSGISSRGGPFIVHLSRPPCRASFDTPFHHDRSSRGGPPCTLPQHDRQALADLPLGFRILPQPSVYSHSWSFSLSANSLSPGSFGQWRSMFLSSVIAAIDSYLQYGFRNAWNDYFPQ